MVLRFPAVPEPREMTVVYDCFAIVYHKKGTAAIQAIEIVPLDRQIVFMI